jgi:protein-tyrosine phosphatase
MIRVLFVCMGNICRSPMAQGVLENRLQQVQLEDRIQVDSAGTHRYHTGESPDPRGVAAASRRGIDIRGQRARGVRGDDFMAFDLILAMDTENERALRAQCPPAYGERVRLVTDFAPQLREREVPDPYYGGHDGFEKVLDMLELCMHGVVDELNARLGARNTTTA